jgi:hypothetical protein
MAILWSNNASTTVSGSITPTATTVNLAAGTGVEFPSPTGGDYFCATFYDQATKTINEIVHVTARSGDVCTIVRAQEGTVAATWNAGDIFANLVTAGTLRAFVQAGTGPANTSVLYVGTDTSTTPGLVVATTNPVPASLAVGMQFNIWIKNTNPGPVNCQFNGGASIPATRSNGAAMVGGDLTASEEMSFIYNGVNFNTLIPNLANHPPQTTFYVRTDGNDNNTGLANDPADAFATIYGAINAISTRYISQNTITVRVADGNYIGGFGVNGGYISSWNIVGNVTNPQNVTIDATSLSPPAGSVGGTACTSGTGGNLTVSGMTFKSYYWNITTENGGLTCHDCHFTGSVSGLGGPVVSQDGGYIQLYGSCTYDPLGHNTQCIFDGTSGGIIVLGYADAYTTTPLYWNFVSAAPTVGIGVAMANSGGAVYFYMNQIGWSGFTCNGPKYNAGSAGGIAAETGSLNSIPATGGGIVNAPGWVM